jgi:hypothetical protein
MFRSTSFAERVRVVVEDVLEAVDIVLSEPLEAGARHVAAKAGAERDAPPAGRSARLWRVASRETERDRDAPANRGRRPERSPWADREPGAAKRAAFAPRAHPHRRPARVERRRRPGAVEPARGACVCAVRAAGPGRHGPFAS